MRLRPELGHKRIFGVFRALEQGLKGWEKNTPEINFWLRHWSVASAATCKYGMMSRVTFYGVDLSSKSVASKKSAEVQDIGLPLFILLS